MVSGIIGLFCTRDNTNVSTAHRSSARTSGGCETMLQVASDEANPQAQPCGTAEHGSQFPDVKDVFNGVRMRRTCTPDVAQSLSPCLTSTIAVASVGPSTCSPSSTLAVIAPDQPVQSGWKVVDLCAQCASQDLQAAHVHGSSEGCCSTLKCAFIRGYDEIDRVLRILGPFTTELEGDQSPNANHVLMLCGTADGAATSLLWQLSGIIRWAEVMVCLELQHLVAVHFGFSSFHTRSTISPTVGLAFNGHCASLLSHSCRPSWHYSALLHLIPQAASSSVPATPIFLSSSSLGSLLFTAFRRSKHTSIAYSTVTHTSLMLLSTS